MESTTTTKKLYKRKMSIFWWTGRWTHLRFILRELTSLCVMVFAVELTWLISTISGGEASYKAFIATMSNPLMIVANLFILGGLLFHSITWFELAPKAMVIKVGKSPLPASIVAGSNYLGWIVISAFIIWVLI